MAMVGGSAYWESDRAKRTQFNELVEEKKKKEKHEAWIRELEIREEEEVELRKMRDRMMRGKAGMREDEARAAEVEVREAAGQPKGGFGSIRSALEAEESRRNSPILEAVKYLWERRR